jgi:ADP-heptose:LPS heptosyltransferase
MKPKRILVIDLHLIGDIVMLSPFLSELPKRYPDAKIDLIAGRWAREILKNNNAIDNFFMLNAPWVCADSWAKMLRQFFSLLARSKNIHWDFAVDVRGDLRNIFLLYLLRPRLIVGYNFTGGSSILDVVVPDDGSIKSLISHHEGILETILGYKANLIPKLTLSLEELIEADKYKRYIGFHFEASNALRQYPINEAVHLIDYWSTKTDLPLMMFTMNAQSEYIMEILSKVNSKSRGQLKIWSGGLRQLVIALSKAEAIFCVDSGPSHIAAALGVNTFIVYGPNIYSATGPVNLNAYPIERNPLLSCQPCDQKKCISSLSFKECYYESAQRTITLSKSKINYR